MNDKKISLYSKDIIISKILDQYQKNQKLYSKLLESLSVLGNFIGKINVDLYEKIEEKDNEQIKLYCADIEDNIFIFCPLSTQKKDLFIVEKLTNTGTLMYDLSLSKKYKLTNDNINLIKTQDVYDFKFGRLITDNKSFYTLYLGNDVIYQVEIDFTNEKTILAQELLVNLNKFEKTPNFTEYINLFETSLNMGNFDLAILSSYKNFIKNNSIKIDNSIELPKQKIIK